MSRGFQDFSLPPTARHQWRRAIDELLIDAIFGAPRPVDIHSEHACPTGDDDNMLPPILVAAE